MGSISVMLLLLLLLLVSIATIRDVTALTLGGWTSSRVRIMKNTMECTMVCLKTNTFILPPISPHRNVFKKCDGGNSEIRPFSWQFPSVTSYTLSYKIPEDKIFGRQNFLQQVRFCSTKFCPIRYFFKTKFYQIKIIFFTGG